MSNVTFTFSIEGDSEGYVTFECPFCRAEFKLQAGEYQDEDKPVEELFCPYCGLSKEKNEFLSSEVVEQVEILAQHYLIEQLNRSFKKMSKSINRSGHGIIKMKYKPLKKVEMKKLKTEDAAETEFRCSCCDHRVKALYCAGASKIFCPYCGVDI